MKTYDIQNLDLKVNWHPCTQMKDFETFKPLVIARAYDSYLELTTGQKMIDGISSWWCKSLGHNHPALKEALSKQLESSDQVIFANTTTEPIVRLSEKLTQMIPFADRVFYAGDGSCAIEIAMKMSLQSRFIQGDTNRTQFINLKNSYHGDTIGALSVSDIGRFKDPFSTMLFNSNIVEPLYVSSSHCENWKDAKDYWAQMEQALEPYQRTATAVIVEPILQGTGGMKLYSKDFLARLVAWAKAHHIHVIADEILTGIGRTGKLLACEHADIQPDFLCLGKGFTSGWLAFSAVLTTNEIYEIFYDDYESGKTFFHSHTYSGNPLGASIALATLDIIENEQLCRRANRLQTVMRSHMEEIAEQTGVLTNIRGIGAVIAADLVSQKEHLPYSRLGYQVCNEAIRRGALLRPIGDTIYWLPPLIISEQILEDLREITFQAIQSVY